MSQVRGRRGGSLSVSSVWVPGVWSMSMSRYEVLEIIRGPPAADVDADTEPVAVEVRPGHIMVVLEESQDGCFPLDLVRVAERGAYVMDVREAVEESRDSGPGLVDAEGDGEEDPLERSRERPLKESVPEERRKVLLDMAASGVL